MSQFVLLFPRLEVTAANAAAAWWFLAPPSPTAYVGFGQALALKCAEPDQTGFRGVGVVLHDYRLRAEKVPGTYSYLPHQLRSAGLINSDDYSSKNKHALSLQPTARCDLTVSVSVVFDELAEIDLKKVATFMRNARIAGGVVSESVQPIGLTSQAEVKKRLGTGFALHNRSDLMNLQVGEDQLDALLRATKPTKEAREQNPWVMPATLGYAAVTDVKDRIWTRDGYPHAFAEPLVGLVQLKSLREANIPTWKYQNPSAQVFMVGY